MPRLEVSGAVRPLYGSLGVKGLMLSSSLSQTFHVIFIIKVTTKPVYALLFSQKHAKYLACHNHPYFVSLVIMLISPP